jgi:plasmid stabilization system protein ParE
MSGYAFHPGAFADLDEIGEYIAEDSLDAADRVLADIHSTPTTLAASPRIGHPRPAVVDVGGLLPFGSMRLPRVARRAI